MPQQHNDPSYFDVGYGLASASISANGFIVCATTQAIYHGFTVLASSAGGLFKVFDSTATTGKLIDIVLFGATVSTQAVRFQPVIARSGLVVQTITATGIQGSVFFVPKG